MQFEKIRAHPFGPFDHDALTLLPGLNVVYGPNEAGKSTWHAALYAGLCGMKKKKGGLNAEDKRFRNRHRPWDGGGKWAVSAVVALEDGRRIELHHDLANAANSCAVDADLADRDYSNQIMYEGAPDGSRWLGLDRRSFLGVACVRQAQILGLLDDAGALQEDLQRAAATAGTDGTAARALDLLAAYRSEHVGSEYAPKKPLRAARRRVDAATSALDAARQAQARYAARRRDVEQLAREAEAAAQEVAALRAARAGEAAAAAERRAAHAADLPALAAEGRRRPAAGSDPGLAGACRAAAPYVAVAAAAVGLGLALADTVVPGVLIGAPGAGYLAWWWLARRRAAEAAAQAGRLLAELRADAARLREEAAALAKQVAPSMLDAARGAAPDRLAAAERDARSARAAGDTARG